MLPDPGCYGERYRRGHSVFGLAAVLPAVGLGLLLQHQLFFVLVAVLPAIQVVLALALPRVAFRADHAGITLGSDWQLPRPRAVFIPWADVEKIILYCGYTSSGAQVQ